MSDVYNGKFFAWSMCIIMIMQDDVVAFSSVIVVKKIILNEPFSVKPCACAGT